LEKIIFENFNISENNIISVELAKVLGYLFWAAQAPDKIEEISCTYQKMKR
jgi:hypothetical protein